MECGVRFQPARLFCLFFPEASHRAATVNPRIGLANRNHSIFLKDGSRSRQIRKMQTIGKKKKFILVNDTYRTGKNAVGSLNERNVLA